MLSSCYIVSTNCTPHVFMDGIGQRSKYCTIKNFACGSHTQRHNRTLSHRLISQTCVLFLFSCFCFVKMRISLLLLLKRFLRISMTCISKVTQLSMWNITDKLKRNKHNIMHSLNDKYTFRLSQVLSDELCVFPQGRALLSGLVQFIVNSTTA